MEKIYAIQIATRAGVAISSEKQTSLQRKIGTNDKRVSISGKYNNQCIYAHLTTELPNT